MAIRVEDHHVTFIAPPKAHALVGDFSDWKDRPIALQPGQELRLEFAPDAFVEYAFLDETGQPFADPDNPITTQNPWYSYPRAAVLPKHQPSPDLGPTGAAQGTVERLVWASATMGDTRRAYVYTPAKSAGQALPLFLVQDGVAYHRTGKLGQVSDKLLAENAIRPAVFVFLEPNDRTQEYWLNDRYLEFLIAEVLPMLEDKLSLLPGPAHRGLWGASLGGLIAMYAALRHPNVFGTVVAQSGAYQAMPGGHTQGRPIAQAEWLVQAFAQNPATQTRFSLDCGQLEWLLGSNRRMAGVLFDQGHTHQYFEQPSGHNWVTWRNGLGRHLRYVLAK